jgi:uncharacterized repeat protein (TIGR01451 family)
MKALIRRDLSVSLLASVVFVWGHVAPAPGDAQSQSRGGEVSRTEKAYPTGDKATSVVLLERVTPTEVRVGQGLAYTVKVTNLTRVEINQVVVTEEFPASFKVGTVLPEPMKSETGRATWEWPKLGPRETKEIRISGSAGGVEDLTFCATVTFSTVACATTRIVEPNLVLTKSAPDEVLVCDPIPLRFVVGNTGTGVARNVRVTDELPKGWATADGKTALAFDAGDLAAGQSREFSANARASETGEFTNTASAVEDGGLTVRASATTAVRKPALVVSKTGPGYRYVGRPAKFEITVANDGDASAQRTVLADAVPAGTQFVAASDDGRVADGKVTWNLGTIAAGSSKTVNLTVRPTQRGTIRNTAVAKAVCAEGTASASLEVRGIPAILLEVIDIHDPIEIGSNETYEIVVVNQGSAEGTNIVVACTLPPEQEYVSSTGPTQAKVEGETAAFAPLPSLAPKAKVTYRVVVKGVKAGDVRFKVSMTSDQVKTPVEETESTHVY